MLPKHLRSTSLLLPLVLAAATACRDTEPVAPLLASKPHFAQGVGGVWTVNTLVDPGDGTCDDTECTLREAIHDALSGDKILFESSLQGDIKLTQFALHINDKDLAIDGAGRIGIDAQSSSRALIISTGLAHAMSLTGLTVKNGRPGANAVPGFGGGIWIFGTTAGGPSVTIRNSTISGNLNSVADGGGIYLDETSTLTLINSTVSANSSTANSGGGIANEGGKLNLVNTTVSNNSAKVHGGGIYSANGGALSLVASTISGNKIGLGFGGGIYSLGGTVVLRSSAVTRNEADLGSGIGTTTSTVTLANSIVAGNLADEDCHLFNTSIGTLGYNVVVHCIPAPAPTDVVVTGAQVFSEVIENTLKDNGGPTMTHALIARGRAIDAGYCPGETADQRGFARPVDVAGMPNALDGCDIGPYEAQGPVVAVADLMVSQTVDKSSVKQGELLTYFVRVQNLGPQTAPNVILNNVLSAGATFFEARANKGTFTAPPRGETGTVTWNLGDMTDQANEVAEIRVTVLVKGKTTITNQATVTGDVSDPNAANNTASITVTVAPGTSGGGGKKSG